MRSSLKNVLAIIVSSILFYSCSDTNENIAAFKALDKSLAESSKILDDQNDRFYHSLQQRLQDPRTVEKAKTLQPKQALVRTYSESLINYLDTLKFEVKREAGLNIANGEEIFEEEGRAAGEKVFEKMGKAKELDKRLELFKTGLLSIDSSMKQEFESEILELNKQDSKSNKEKQLLKGLPTIGVLAMLTRLQNKTRIIEYMLLQYIDRKTAYHDDWYTSTSVLTGLNSSYVRKGDKVEVFAGVGAFSLKAKPAIIINGKVVTPGPEGVAIFSFKAPGKQGKHFVNAAINYTDIDGSRKSVSKKIDYTVIKD
jgi:gliding motility-associated protein GldM